MSQTHSILFLLFAAYGSLALGLSGSNPIFYIGIGAAILVTAININKGAVAVWEKLISWPVFVGLLLSLFLTRFLLLWVDFYGLQYHCFDTGIYARTLSNFTANGDLFNSILQKNAFANHFTPNLLLLAPFFFIYDSFLWLVGIKLLAFFACPFILYRISCLTLGRHSKLCTLAPILWLVNKPLARTMDFEFQVSSLSQPFILLAFLFAILRSWWKCLFTLLFLLGFKEHLALVWISMGLFLALELGEVKRGSVFAIVGILFGLLFYFIVMPSFWDSGSWVFPCRKIWAF